MPIRDVKERDRIGRDERERQREQEGTPDADGLKKRAAAREFQPELKTPHGASPSSDAGWVATRPPERARIQVAGGAPRARPDLLGASHQTEPIRARGLGFETRQTEARDSDVHVPAALDASWANRPTRTATPEMLVRAAERASAYSASLRDSNLPSIVGEASFEAKLGGALLDERIQNITVDNGGQRQHVINQDFLFRVPQNAAKAFKEGFFGQAGKVGARMKVVAFERDGRWVTGENAKPWAPGNGRFIVEANQAQIGTDLPGVAPATAYLMVDPKSLRETADETSFEIQFLNPWGEKGLFPPYVDSIGRYGIHDHRDGTATVFAYWVGDAGKTLMEPTLRETVVGKTLKSGWDWMTSMASAVPVVGPAAHLMARGTELGALGMAKTATAAADAVLSATGATEALFPLAALQHVRFYERDWCNPERWGQVAAEREGRASAPLAPMPARPRALPQETSEGYLARAWRVLAGGEPK